MKGFTIGVMAGSAVAAIGFGYLLKDAKTCNAIRRKGKKMAVKAERMVDNMVDDILDM